MRKHLALLIILNFPAFFYGQTKNTNDHSTSAPFTFEATVGSNNFFFKDEMPLQRAFTFNTPIKSINSLIYGLMIHANLDSKKNRFKVGLGVTYGSFKIDQEKKDTIQRGVSILKCDQAFVRTDLLLQYIFLPDLAVNPFVSAGLGFNFFAKSNPAINADYRLDFFPFPINEKNKLLAVTFNPKVAVGAIYKRSRLELSYAIPTNIFDDGKYKIRMGYYGVNYYFRISNL